MPYKKTPFTLGRKYKYSKPKYKKKTFVKSKYSKPKYKKKSQYSYVKKKISKSPFYPKKIIKQGRRPKTRTLLQATEVSLLAAMLFQPEAGLLIPSGDTAITSGLWTQFIDSNPLPIADVYIKPMTYGFP